MVTVNQLKAQYENAAQAKSQLRSEVIAWCQANGATSKQQIAEVCNLINSCLFDRDKRLQAEQRFSTTQKQVQFARFVCNRELIEKTIIRINDLIEVMLEEMTHGMDDCEFELAGGDRWFAAQRKIIQQEVGIK